MTMPKTLLAAWNIKAKKTLGQHFLTDPSTAKMIVTRARISENDTVLEIGAGLGAMTIAVARAAKKVYAVEIDPRMVDLLQTELLAQKIQNTVIIPKNIFDLDISQIVPEEATKLLIMGNLPYNVSSQIIVRLIQNRESISRAIIMLQKELAHRLIAVPGGKDYGRLAVMLSYCAEVKPLAQVKGTLFFPPAKVDSEVIEILFKDPSPATVDEPFFFEVVKAAFSQRRKTLKNALAGSHLHIDQSRSKPILSELGIETNRRAETLSIPEFVGLANRLRRSEKIN